ncbi:MAG: AAA family ATPase [Deltaproteobacteria bacterium]|nr:AAA family ATPase [Deltaproteobacteria bacterium]
MNRLEIRLLGGFHASWGGKAIDSFESQKVRALFSYLASWPGRTFSRDQLGDLLWPNQRSESARRNLRQALYNLRRAVVREAGEGFDPLETAHQSVRFRSEPWIWLDIDAFQEALQGRQREDGSFDASALSRVVQLYKGDFLAGFFVKDCINFETWMLQEQEQLREAVVGALQALIEHHLTEGNFALGVRYSRQLLRIDPLSEEAHRKLMHLYALSGRRGRAVEIYQSLCQVLQTELGVEPLEKTKADYEAIVAEALPGPAVIAKAEHSGPVVPLVGRDDAIALLRKTWSLVRQRHGSLTLVTGESGVGKTRLLRSFLDEATRGGQGMVLRGRCYDLPTPPYLGAFADALGNAFNHEVDLGQDLLEGLSRECLEALGQVIPGIRELLLETGMRPRETHAGSSMLATAISQFLEVLCQPSPDTSPPRPVIVFLDDMHWTDPSSRELLAQLATLLSSLPVWLVVTLEPETAAAEDTLESANQWEGGRRQTISLERLRESDVAEMAGVLAEPSQVGAITEKLAACAGLPLAITESLNCLWDTGTLVAGSEGRLTLRPDQVEEPSKTVSPQSADRSLEEVILERVTQLPTSTRRLLSLAAVAGFDFDSGLLQEAEREHRVVVETGLKILVDHWVIRHVLGYWADSRRQRDIALWAGGTGKATFEFTHPKIRTALYNSLNPRRRQVLHRQVAEVLEDRLAGGDPHSRFPLIYQYLEAGANQKALEHLRMAAEAAAEAGATSTARAYLEQALQCSKKLEHSSEEDELELWQGETRKIGSAVEKLQRVSVLT